MSSLFPPAVNAEYAFSASGEAVCFEEVAKVVEPCRDVFGTTMAPVYHNGKLL